MLSGISWAYCNQKLSGENRCIGFVLNFCLQVKLSLKNPQKQKPMYLHFTFISDLWTPLTVYDIPYFIAKLLLLPLNFLTARNALAVQGITLMMMMMTQTFRS